MGTPRMLILFLGAAALLTGAIASLALDNWWILVGVMALHLVASAFTIGYGFIAAGQNEDKPDPVTQARLEEEGRAGADEPDLPKPSRDDGPRDREVFS